MAANSDPGGLMLHQKDEFDIWICKLCGWKYPNAKPSAKIRKNHRKHCPGINGPDTHHHHGGSSDDEASDGEHHHGAKEASENVIDGERSSNGAENRSRDVVSVEPAEERDQDEQTTHENPGTPAGQKDGSEPGETPRLKGEQAAHGDSTNADASIPLMLHQKDEHDVWICKDCGWRHPNAKPSAKVRRHHKKQCTGHKESEAGAGGGSSDEHTDDEGLHRHLPFHSASPVEGKPIDDNVNMKENEKADLDAEGGPAEGYTLSREANRSASSENEISPATLNPSDSSSDRLDKEIHEPSVEPESLEIPSETDSKCQDKSELNGNDSEISDVGWEDAQDDISLPEEPTDFGVTAIDEASDQFTKTSHQDGIGAQEAERTSVVSDLGGKETQVEKSPNGESDTQEGGEEAAKELGRKLSQEAEEKPVASSDTDGGDAVEEKPVASSDTDGGDAVEEKPVASSDTDGRETQEAEKELEASLDIDGKETLEAEEQSVASSDTDGRDAAEEKPVASSDTDGRETQEAEKELEASLDIDGKETQEAEKELEASLDIDGKETLEAEEKPVASLHTNGRETDAAEGKHVASLDTERRETQEVKEKPVTSSDTDGRETQEAEKELEASLDMDGKETLEAEEKPVASLHADGRETDAVEEKYVASADTKGRETQEVEEKPVASSEAYGRETQEAEKERELSLDVDGRETLEADEKPVASLHTDGRELHAAEEKHVASSDTEGRETQVEETPVASSDMDGRETQEAEEKSVSSSDTDGGEIREVEKKSVASSDIGERETQEAQKKPTASSDGGATDTQEAGPKHPKTPNVNGIVTLKHKQFPAKSKPSRAVNQWASGRKGTVGLKLVQGNTTGGWVSGGKWNHIRSFG